MPPLSEASISSERMQPDRLRACSAQAAIWHIDREAAVFIGAGRALLMQLAHPWVATAIADHSSALSDPIGRFHRTFEIVFTMVFGSLDQALETSRRLHQRHASIQ